MWWNYRDSFCHFFSIFPFIFSAFSYLAFIVSRLIVNWSLFTFLEIDLQTIGRAVFFTFWDHSLWSKYWSIHYKNGVNLPFIGGGENARFEFINLHTVFFSRWGEFKLLMLYIFNLEVILLLTLWKSNSNLGLINIRLSINLTIPLLIISVFIHFEITEFLWRDERVSSESLVDWSSKLEYIW